MSEVTRRLKDHAPERAVPSRSPAASPAATMFSRNPVPPGLWHSPRHASPGDTPSQGPASLNAYWTSEAHVIADCLGSGPDGLSQVEADRRLRSIGPNRLRNHQTRSRLEVVWAQLRNPLFLILVFAACASASTGEWIDATIVLAIVVASVGIGYSREYTAQTAVAALQAQVQMRTNVAP